MSARRERRGRWAAWLVTTLLACAPGDPGGGPPEIRLGEDICSRCRMIISDAGLAAALTREGAEPERFDDVGCLVAYLRDQREAARRDEGAEHRAAQGRAWLRDRDSGQWLAPESAWLVESPELITPMGSGLVAFAGEPDARAFQRARGGTILRWSELLERSDEPGG